MSLFQQSRTIVKVLAFSEWTIPLPVREPYQLVFRYCHYGFLYMYYLGKVFWNLI